MRQVISDLFDCYSNVDSTYSRKQLATIIRRELEIDLMRVEAPPNPSLFVVTRSEINLARDGHKLQAVKQYKDRTGLSLMESKRAIETAM